MTDQIDDFSMAYVDSCDRLSLLLIHGFPLNSVLWTPQLDELASFARVIAPDLRGHGVSDAVAGPYSMGMLANDCADLLAHLVVTPPFVVCGLSMGGYVAFELYRQHPELVVGLILVATRAVADSDEGKANRDKAIEGVQANGVQTLVDGLLPKLLSPKTAASDQALVKFVQEIIESTSVEGAIGALQGMRDRPDFTPILTQIDVPTLIIHGADDQLIPVSEAEAMHKGIQGSKLVIIPGAGHLPNLEKPDEFNDAVIDFLEEVEATFEGEE